MAKPADNKPPAGDAPTSAPDGAPKKPLFVRTPLRGARDLWQLPVLFAGLALIVSGVLVWIRGVPGPDFRAALDDASALIERQQYDASLQILNGPLREEIGTPKATEELRAEYHALRADALYLAQKAAPPVSPGAARTNNTNIVEEYEQAHHAAEHTLTPRRRAFLAETLLDLGEREKAIEEIESLPDDEAPRRQRLLKRVITELLATDDRDAVHHAEELIEALRRDRALSEDDRLWSIARRSSLDLAHGRPGRVIDGLLPEIQRLESRTTREAGELFLLLGRAYLETGDPEKARETLAFAERILPPGDEARGLSDVLLARIAQSRGEAEEARDRFASVSERFPGTPTQLAALLGLGETEADLSRFPESIEAFRLLTELLPKHASAEGVTPAIASASAAQRARARAAAEDFEGAVAYAQLALAAHPADRAPADAVVHAADAHSDLARHLLGDGQDDSPITRVPPDALESARRHFESARALYERHVERAMVDAPETATESLWKAADAADRAGDLDDAIRLFTQFTQSRRGDPRALQGAFRLARAFQAKGAYDTAITIYEEIIRANPGSDEAYRAYVPLAQSHILAGKEGSEQKAEDRLLQVIGGRLFQPTSPQFRDALVELGRLYLRTARYADAIERLDEALQRYPADAQTARLRFDLADANRLSAAQLEKRLSEAMPLTERSEIERTRLDRLNRALDLYAQVRTDIELVPPERLEELDRLMLRNTIFYRADCAYDLADYDAAIKFYDAAAQRYASDPASLVAMVQIVNCYASLGKWREARTAHERAKARLKELPEDAWKTAAAPMDRRHWERWLDASMRLDQADARADAEPPAP
ncbi:MAG TPA: hypothetical protein DEB06_01860 [Phycisphaerales bacterium]|nr:hypothetical protein [Phycisphaerales bacterium]